MGMGIGYKIGNVNGKECESIAREWKGVGIEKAIPGHLPFYLFIYFIYKPHSEKGK